jgi:hypothetical protein
VPDGTMVNEGDVDIVAVGQFQILPQHLPGWTGGHDKGPQNTQPLGKYFNLGTPKFKVDMLPTRQCYLFFYNLVCSKLSHGHIM